MRDGVFLSRAGHPTVVVVNDSFGHAAKAQAKALGLPELRIYVYPQHKPGELGDAETAKGVKAASDILKMLEFGN